MDAVLGIDIGTTATKGLLLTLDGEVIGEGHYPYEMHRIGEDGYEQDPEEFWRGIISCCKQALSQNNDNTKVLALALSTQAGATIPLGLDNEPISKAISWMDHRGKKHMHEVISKFSQEEIYQKSGWNLMAASSLMHIIRLRNEEPEVFNNAKRFAFVNDFLIHRLTGKFIMDPSNAGITPLYNINTGDWDGDLLEIAGIDKNMLSDMASSGISGGNLTEEAATALGLTSDTMVINGAHDQYCAAMGVGACNPGDLLVSTGTAWVILTVLSDMKSALDTGMGVSTYPIGQLYGALSSAGAVGKGMGWFTDQILDKINTKSKNEWIDEAVGNSPIGSNGLTFIAPAVARSKGAVSGFFNLDINHSLSDMARAIMECSVYEVKKLSINLIERGTKLSRVIMVGRPATSKMWAQMLSDVLSLPLEVPVVKEAASLGAAMLAAIGIGALEKPEHWYGQIRQRQAYEPDSYRKDLYNQRFEEYVEVLERLREK